MERVLEKPLDLTYSDDYPQEVINEIERRLHEVAIHLAGIEDESAIRTLAQDLIKGTSMELIIKKKIGYKGKLGLELVKAKLRNFYATYKRLPKFGEN